MGNGFEWFLTHHSVYHKQKNKIRVVFNCSLDYGGVSLNSRLLQGPDLTNSLVGVLLRFWKERVAFEKMFYMVRVPVEQAKLLKFCWYDESGAIRYGGGRYNTLLD